MEAAAIIALGVMGDILEHPIVAEVEDRTAVEEDDVGHKLS